VEAKREYKSERIGEFACTHKLSNQFCYEKKNGESERERVWQQMYATYNAKKAINISNRNLPAEYS